MLIKLLCLNVKLKANWPHYDIFLKLINKIQTYLKLKLQKI